MAAEYCFDDRCSVLMRSMPSPDGTGSEEVVIKYSRRRLASAELEHEGDIYTHLESLQVGCSCRVQCP